MLCLPTRDTEECSLAVSPEEKEMDLMGRKRKDMLCHGI